MNYKLLCALILLSTIQVQKVIAAEVSVGSTSEFEKARQYFHDAYFTANSDNHDLKDIDKCTLDQGQRLADNFKIIVNRLHEDQTSNKKIKLKLIRGSGKRDNETIHHSKLYSIVEVDDDKEKNLENCSDINSLLINSIAIERIAKLKGLPTAKKVSIDSQELLYKKSFAGLILGFIGIGGSYYILPNLLSRFCKPNVTRVLGIIPSVILIGYGAYVGFQAHNYNTEINNCSAGVNQIGQLIKTTSDKAESNWNPINQSVRESFKKLDDYKAKNLYTNTCYGNTIFSSKNANFPEQY